MTCALEQYVHHRNAYVLDNGAADTTIPNTTVLQVHSLAFMMCTADDVLSELPDYHRPKAVCQRVFEIYWDVSEGGAIS